jgi:hypothetical protein
MAADRDLHERRNDLAAMAIAEAVTLTDSALCDHLCGLGRVNKGDQGVSQSKIVQCASLECRVRAGAHARGAAAYADGMARRAAPME